MTMRTAVILSILMAIVVLAIIAVEFVGPGLFVPDGHNVVKNGSFEDGNPAASNDEQVGAKTGLGDCKLLCDGSTTIDAWEVSGKGFSPDHTCSNGKAVPSQIVLEMGDAISGISRVASQAARSIG